ncbi:MAG: hypothetical protein ACKOJF_15225 [Planctomycetaceae bacterium]
MRRTAQHLDRRKPDRQRPKPAPQTLAKTIANRQSRPGDHSQTPPFQASRPAAAVPNAIPNPRVSLAPKAARDYSDFQRRAGRANRPTPW